MKFFRPPFAALILLFIMSSCDYVEIENNRRIVVSGQVLDFNRNALPEVEVSVTANNIILGIDETNTNGHFEVLSLETENQSLNFLVGSNQFNTNFTSVSYVINENAEVRTANDYDLGVVIIGRRAGLNVAIEKETNSTAEELEYSVRFMGANCSFVISRGQVMEDAECYQEENLSGRLNAERPSAEFSLSSILDTMVAFEYSINGAPSQTILINLTDRNNDFTFTY